MFTAIASAFGYTVVAVGGTSAPLVVLKAAAGLLLGLL